MAAADGQKNKLFFSKLLSHGGGGALKRPVIHKRAPPAAAKLAVVDVEGALLLPRSLFPYFMLVAVEAGGFLRGLVLLLLYPFILALPFFSGADAAVRAMAFVAFCGLRAARFRAGRAVLPRWLLQDVALQGFDLAVSPARRQRQSSSALYVSRMPRVMVEPFLKEYLLIQDQESRDDVIVAREMKTTWGFCTGFMEDYQWDLAGVVEEDAIGFTGGSSSSSSMESFFFLNSLCKEIYTITDEEKAKWQPLPPRSHPRPVVFHDGRLAILPTPLAIAATLAWLPMGALLAVARIAIALSLPYRLATPLLAFTGQSWRLRGSLPPSAEHVNGQLYVCNHRTLIDPVYVSIALNRPVRAVSYSLSRFSDLISPIGATVRLTRDRAHDGAAMAALLQQGSQVVVCPEGTTCREPYLLRFSPLFAELTDGVVPVALAVETAMFHATTAGGWKWLDPLYYLANPRMCYTVEFLPRVETKAKAAASSAEVANEVQRRVAEALGYQCTMLTRKEKYRMLAGNHGVVQRRRGSSMEERK